MRLESFISDLLYEHDCVVIPGFGGLVSNYRPARLNSQTNMIFPPSKYVGFNRHLKNSDGLLVSHLSALLSISYKEAQERIDEQVSDWQSALQRDGRVFWEKIGTFFYDKDGSLQFLPEEQENYLLSSFGLYPVQLTPVLVQQNEPGITPEEIEREKKVSSIGWRVAAAMAIPLMAAGIWFASSRIQDDGFNLATLNPFHTVKIKSDYSPENGIIPTTQDWLAASSPLQAYLDDSSNREQLRFDFEKLDFTDNGILIAKNLPAIPDKTDKAENKKNSELKQQSFKGKFAVIGGAFADSDNANRFLTKLKQDGFDASFAGKKGSLQLVAFGFYDTLSEAQSAVSDIYASGAGSAWIKRY